MSKKVIIVGGGIIGTSSAWFLSHAGWQVQVLDRSKIGQACSGGNCGLVCPSHVLPLTEPGAFKSAVQALLSRDAPFRIRPRMDPALWSWMWNFAKRCNEKQMIQAAHAIQALLSSAVREYEQWMQVEQFDCEWQEKGLLFTYRTEKAWRDYEQTNEMLTEHFGEPAQMLDADQTLQLEPAFRKEICGSWFYPEDAHLRPDKLIYCLRKRLEERGVEFLEDCELRGVQGRNGELLQVQSPLGEFQADAFLFASGAWTPLLQEHLGVRVPIEPGKGYSITMPRPKVCPSIPIIFPEHRVAVTPMHSGYRLGSIMEFAGYDATIRPERLALLRSGAEHYLKEPHCEPVVSEWYGWRPMTYDSIPVIDVSPKWGNAWIATGHNMLGLSMAPSTGRLVTELIERTTPHLDPEPYRLARFQ